MSLIRIATRASQLAMWQAEHIAGLIQQADPDVEVQIVDVTTTGDVDQTQPLRAFGGMGVFTKEVQRALLDDRADIAVHSLKDLPTESADERLVLACVPEREVKWDALVLPASTQNDHPTQDDPLQILPEGCRVGTGSLRRQAQLKWRRPDLNLMEIRGNLNTRLKKLDDGEYDALVLAAAGLTRLEMTDRISAICSPPALFPAVGQGALGIECRSDAQDVQQVLMKISCHKTWGATLAERSLLRSLRAGCHAPVGVNAEWHEETKLLQLTAIVLNPEGTERIEVSDSVELNEIELSVESLKSFSAPLISFGEQAAQKLLDQGAQKLIAST